jgi:branched-subunit amino acid aminotransferase/4-amino-4-deoxychorismate lyase
MFLLVLGQSTQTFSSNMCVQVEERLVSVDELVEADEVFCTGTAVVVSPVGSVTYHGKKYVIVISEDNLYLVH